jgi:hypothetical protein
MAMKFSTKAALLIIIIFNPILVLESKISISEPGLLNSSSINDYNSDSVIKRGLPKVSPSSYTPVTSLSLIGDDFDLRDKLSVSHEFTLNLDSTNGRTNSFNLTVPSTYSNFSLHYNMKINTTKDDYPVRLEHNDEDHVMGYFVWAFAQAFEVTWDYAVFSGADIYLTGPGPSSGIDELAIYLVKASGPTGPPNMADIRSNELNGPYNVSHPLPGGFSYFDFEDVVIESGKYFVVANMTVIDEETSFHGFNWIGYRGSSNSDTYQNSPNGWELVPGPSQDCSLIVELMESDVNGDPISFTNPTTINLMDNGNPVLTRIQQISTIGNHTLTADSSHSYEITFNNSYIFSKDYLATSELDCYNSTFGDFSIFWKLNWDVTNVNCQPYSNLIREHILKTPEDWDALNHTLLVNSSVTFDSEKVTRGYGLDLSPLDYGSGFYESSFEFSTYSPNYLYDYTLTNGTQETVIFDLGYWVANGSHAFGYSGSNITSEIFIKDLALSDIGTGELNSTVFANDANIIPLKPSVYSNLTYIDNSSYSQLISNQTVLGKYDFSTSFDPSVYETDKPGYWTMSYLWNNGTEFGFFTKRISVHIATESNFEWETSPGSGLWSSDNLTPITRLNSESIEVRAQYFSRTEPYFSGEGVPIALANVTLNTSWDLTDSFSFSDPYYIYSIPVYAPAGENNVIVSAGGDFLSPYSINIPLIVYSEFAISFNQIDYSTNYSNSIVIDFLLSDELNLGVAIIPDTVNISINGLSILQSQFDVSQSIVNNTLLTFDPTDLGFGVGTHELNVTVSKDYYTTSTSDEYLSEQVMFQITEIYSTINLISAESKVYYNNQTTLSFEYYDTNHSVVIPDASFTIYFDIEEVDIVTQFYDSDSNSYQVVLRVFEPSVLTMNVFLNISKQGYRTINTFLLATINIDPSEYIPTNPNPSLPIALIVSLTAVVGTALAVGSYFIIRNKSKQKTTIKQAELDRARSIFQSVFMIKKVLIVHQSTSLPVFELDLEADSALDSTLISGVLGAISSIGHEISGAPTGIKRIEYYNFEVTRAFSGTHTVYLFSDSVVNMDIINGLSNIANWFDITFGHQTSKWDGSMTLFHEFRETIREKIVDELYLWLLYTVKLTAEELDLDIKLSREEKRIIGFLKIYEKPSIVLLLDKLDDFSDESIILGLINLKQKGMIVTQNSD